MIQVREVLLHVVFQYGQCFLSKDCIACGRLFRCQLRRDLCFGYACMGPLVIIVALWFCIVFAQLMLPLGLFDHRFACSVGGVVSLGVSLQPGMPLAVEGPSA